MKISAYLYVNRGNDYNLPYLESITSVLWCDEIIIGTDTRFRDGTYEKLLEFKNKNSSHRDHIVIYTSNFDYNSINPHGIIKQYLRDKCNGDWLLELDADEIFMSDVNPREVIGGLSSLTYLVSIPVINFFNGDHLHHEMQKTRECLSQNIDVFKHHLTDETNSYGRMGSTLIELREKASIDDYQIPSNVIESIDTCTIYHYGWYSLSRKWEMKQTLHYYNGRLDGTYQSLNDYILNLDDEPVDFFGPVDIRPLEYYYHAIIQEMNQASLIKFDGDHPVYMQDWLKLQRIIE